MTNPCELDNKYDTVYLIPNYTKFQTIFFSLVIHKSISCSNQFDSAV